MGPDWNWFFNSTAQSAAAIAGIFGAFEITKIVSNMSTFSARCREIESLIQSSRKLEDVGLSVPFSYFNRIVIENQLDRLKNVVREAGKYEDPEHYYDQLNFPQFASKHEVLESIKGRLDELRKMDMNWGHQGFHQTASDPRLAHAIPLINNYVNDVRHQTRAARSLLDNICGHPESSILLTFSIFAVMLLFFVGVIYPLSFLPYTLGSEINLSFSAFLDALFSIKGGLLLSTSLIFLGVMAIFLMVNLRLKYGKEHLEALEYYSQYTSYSPYLKNAEENLTG
jgi:hypothetical protein